jgi:uncharacterized membrane protein
MPERMASHWNAKGQVNGYMSRAWALFFMPGLSILLYLLFLAIPRIDPLKSNIKKFRGYFDNFVILILLFLFYLYLATIFWNRGFRFNMGYIVLPGISILLYYAGIVIENAKRNWFIGIRTPWTLSSDRVWKKTHLIGGKLFKICAIIILISVFFISFATEYVFWIVFVLILALSFGLIAYSYFEYRKKK